MELDISQRCQIRGGLVDTSCSNELGLHIKIYLVFYHKTGEILEQGSRELVESQSLEVFRTS